MMKILQLLVPTEQPRQHNYKGEIQNMNLMKCDYNKIKNWMYRNARPLDIARWKYHFENGNRNDVITALLAYQNSDGGFGHGLEADSWNPNSSPIQAYAACELLFEIDCPRDEPIIQSILGYLESGLDFDGEVWLAEIPSNNNYPHAPWWSYEDNVKEEWGYNPTATLIGFILCYGKKDTSIYIKAKDIAKKAIERYIAKTNSISMHESSCYIRLLNSLESMNKDKDYFFDISSFKSKLIKGINYTIEQDSKKWNTTYCATPSYFIDSPTSIFYLDNKKSMDTELDLLISSRNIDGVWDITWNWGSYEKEFAISENWWKANLVIKNLKLLREFNRIL